MTQDITPDVEFGTLSQPYPAATRLLLEFIKTGTVASMPNAAAEQMVALRLEMDDELMSDDVARQVVESYIATTPPVTKPRPWRTSPVPR